MTEQLTTFHRRRLWWSLRQFVLAILISGGAGFVLSAGSKIIRGSHLHPAEGWILIVISIGWFTVGTIWWLTSSPTLKAGDSSYATRGGGS
jgi:hypothetical protein